MEATEEKKLVFKSEEDKIKAIESLPEDPPPGMDITEFEEDLDRKIEEIQNAEVSEDAPEYNEAQESAEAAGEGEKSKTQEEHEDKAGTSVEDNRISMLEERQQRMQQEYEEKMRKREEEWQKKLDEMKPNKEESSKIDADPQLENQILSVREKIKKIKSEISKEDSEYDDDYNKKVIELNTLTSDLVELTDKKNDTIYKKISDLEAKRAKEEEERRNREVEQQKRTAAQQKKDKLDANVEAFRKGIKEFQSDKTYQQMEKDYVSFSKELAAQYFDKLPESVSGPEQEVAISKYLNKVPAIMEKVEDSGIKEPEELRKYLILSEVNAMYQGYELDKNSGKWVRMKNEVGDPVNLPNLSVAYEYLQQKSGKKGAELLEAQKQAVEEYKKGMESRSNPVELDGSHQHGTVREMSAEEAHKIINLYDEEEMATLARRNSNSPKLKEFNKALVVLGHDAFDDTI